MIFRGVWDAFISRWDANPRRFNWVYGAEFDEVRRERKRQKKRKLTACDAPPAVNRWRLLLERTPSAARVVTGMPGDGNWTCYRLVDG